MSETGLDMLSDIHVLTTMEQPTVTTDSTAMQVDTTERPTERL